MTRSEEILARKDRYNRIERVTDSLNRVIGVKRLRPSQQIRVQELAPGLEGTTTIVDDDPTSDTYGRSFEAPKIGPLVMAASVAEINGSPITFPKTRAELDAVIDMLDGEGITAVSKALTALRIGEDASGDEIKDGAEAAKN